MKVYYHSFSFFFVFVHISLDIDSVLLSEAVAYGEPRVVVAVAKELKLTM